jgi:predicted amidophosphoribosyltransferase
MTAICGYCETEWNPDKREPVCPRCANDGDIKGHVYRDDSAEAQSNRDQRPDTDA